MKKKRQTAKPISFPMALIRGLSLTLLLSLALFLILSYIAYRSQDPAAMLPALSSVFSVITAFLSGFISARYLKKSGLLIGLAAGLTLMIIGALTAAILPGSAEGRGIFILLPLLLAMAAVGGLFGEAKRTRRRRRVR